MLSHAVTVWDQVDTQGYVSSFRNLCLFEEFREL